MNRIILVGKSASGKDYALNELIKYNKLKYLPKITTRPIRENEKEGVNYKYINNLEFEDSIKKGDILIYQFFNLGEGKLWYYGFDKNDFKESQLVIMTPEEISKLTREERSTSFVVYIDMSKDIRLKRLKRRNDLNDDIIRRVDRDDEDFINFIDYDKKIEDEFFNPSSIYEDFINRDKAPSLHQK